MELRIRYLVGFLFGSLAGHARSLRVSFGLKSLSISNADPPCFAIEVAKSRRNVRQSLHHDQRFVSKRLRANNLEYLYES